MIKAVLFDIDGVLLDSFEANLKFYSDLMIKFGFEAPTRENFPNIFHFTMWDSIKTLTKLSTDDEIKKIWEAGASGEVPYPLELLTMPVNAESVIQTLAQTYKLGIVTSRIKNNVYKAPQLLKLENFFSVAISYEDTASHKPHPEPLLLAVERLGVAPHETVYIGDVENDVLSARSAGMKVILYTSKDLKIADAITSDFSTIPELIKNL